MLDMVFTFEHMWQDEEPGRGKWALRDLHLPDLKASLARWQTGLAEVGWNSLYWENHDQPRVVSRWGRRRRAPRDLGQDVGDRAAPAPRHAVRLPG
jgi:oligo-1,6-glucosidase